MTRTLVRAIPSILAVALASTPPAHAALDRTERAIARHIAGDQAAAEELLQRVVDIESPTENPAGVRAVGDAFAAELRAIGFDTHWVEMPPGMKRAGHLVAELEGERGKRLLLLGHLDTVLAGAESYGPQAVHVPGSGERLVVCDRITGAQHGQLGVLLVSRNLAYLSQVQSTLSYSRKLAALSRLSAGIAHEVKNPLNATMIHLELLKLQLAQHPSAMDHVAVIGAQVRRLDEVVQGFLKFMRPEELRLQPVAVAPMIDALLPIIAAEAGKHGIDVHLDFPPDLPEVSADRGLLEQAFLNLALNACQAMPDGGRLRISACQRPGALVEIVFADTGGGIPPEQLARIFDLYYTTKPHGSGIGLSLVYRTVQLHDGQIDVESVPRRGTTFKILLRQAITSPTLA